MAFIHPLLLGALVSVGVPVILHLLMRQKPKHQLFPAFRFLQQRAKTNQKKLRLRHLLLLLLRMLLLTLIVLALARPRLFSDRIGGFLPNQNVAAVLVFDTSRSMEYTVGGRTRLDESKQRALELLEELSEASRVAVVDLADPNREWLSVAQARDRIRNLNLHAGCPPVTSGLGAAYALFSELSQEPATAENETVPRYLYIFSDRTVACWDSGRLGDLTGQRDRTQLNQPAIGSFFIDVGADKPIDAAITTVEVKPQSIPAAKNAEVALKATVSAMGLPCDVELTCKIVGENTAERKAVKLEAGQNAVVEFVKRDLKPGQYQAEITLEPTDALPGDNVRYVTFEVRQPRKILIITDEPDYATYLEVAFAAKHDFDPDVKTPTDIKTAEDLKPYLGICLLSVRAPAEKGADDTTLWDKLRDYVSRGGHLCVFPGRDEMRTVEYQRANDVLPGEFQKPVAPGNGLGVHWDERRFTKHPILSKFPDWKEQGVSFVRRPRTASQFWLVKPAAPQNVIVTYDDKAGSPALLEKAVDRIKGGGKVLMFTTPFDYRSGETDKWNDYADTADAPFLLVIVNEAMKYLVGDLEEVNFSFTSGQVVALALPPSARVPEYTLDGPGVTGSDTRLPRLEGDSDLRLRNTDLAGNYSVSGGNPPWKTKFSLNPAVNEFQLDRVPIEEIEKLLGPKSVLPVQPNKKLTEIVTGQSRQPIELFPWLMLLFVASLVVESYLANRFYKPEQQIAPVAA
jgi:hypothetical protein